MLLHVGFQRGRSTEVDGANDETPRTLQPGVILPPFDRKPRPWQRWATYSPTAPYFGPLLQDVDLLRMHQTQVEIQISHPETFPSVVLRLDTTVRMKRVK